MKALSAFLKPTLDILLNRVTYWIFVSTLILLYSLPKWMTIFNRDWDSLTDQDPFLTYVLDGSYFATGQSIIFTNHPGTPVNLLFAWLTQWLRAVLFWDHWSLGTYQEYWNWVALNPDLYVAFHRFGMVAIMLAFPAMILAVSHVLFKSKWLGLLCAYCLILSPNMIELNSKTLVETHMAFTVPLIFAGLVQWAQDPRNLKVWLGLIFSIALGLSYKLNSVATVLVLLSLATWIAPEQIVAVKDSTRKWLARTVHVLIPLGVSLFFLAILIVKKDSLIPPAIPRTIKIIILSAIYPLAYLLIARFRNWVAQKVTLHLTVLIVMASFVVINIPMSWKAMIGFLLNVEANTRDAGFKWDHVWDHWSMFMASPVRFWTFFAGIVGWYFLYRWIKEGKTSLKFPQAIYLGAMVIPFSFLSFTNYPVRQNYYLLVDAWSYLFLFGMLASLFFARHLVSENSRERMIHWVLVGAMAMGLYPSSFQMNPYHLVAPIRKEMMVWANRGNPATRGGIDPAGQAFYGKTSRDWLEYGVKYVGAPFPLDQTAADRSALENGLLIKYPWLKRNY